MPRVSLTEVPVCHTVPAHFKHCYPLMVVIATKDATFEFFSIIDNRMCANR